MNSRWLHELVGMNLSVTHAPMYLQDPLSIKILENNGTYQQNDFFFWLKSFSLIKIKKMSKN